MPFSAPRAQRHHTGERTCGGTLLAMQLLVNQHYSKERFMSLGTILIIILILVLVGALPTWPHSRQWGYAPSGLLGAVLIILIVLFLMGRL